MAVCDLCNYSPDYLLSNSLKLCAKCFEPDNFNLITKTNAKERYLLTKNDLDDVRHIEYTEIYKTYLYLINDVEYIAILKHGSAKRLKDKLKDKKDKKKNEEMTKMRHKDIRRQYLDNYLKSVDLPGVKLDSSLCINFIEKGEECGVEVDEISRIMIEMNFFYKYTKFPTLLKFLRRKERLSNRSYKFYKWDDKDEEELRSRARRFALYQYIKDNYDDIHKMVLQIPLSLKGLTDQFYDKVGKEKRIYNDELMIKKAEEESIQLEQELINEKDLINEKYLILQDEIGIKI